jgi:hypothetical protein
MSKPQPPKMDAGNASARFVLTPEHLAQIGDACGVPLTERAHADLEEALNCYLMSAAASGSSPTIKLAQKRLDRMRRLAAELQDLTSGRAEEAAEQELRVTLRDDLDVSKDAASRLHVTLGRFLRALSIVSESYAVKAECPEHEPNRRLASDLDIIWRILLDQQRTISPANNGSLFVRFVEAATACLPSHWPWRPKGMREIQSSEALAKALERALPAALDTRSAGADLYVQ